MSKLNPIYGPKEFSKYVNEKDYKNELNVFNYENKCEKPKYPKLFSEEEIILKIEEHCPQEPQKYIEIQLNEIKVLEPSESSIDSVLTELFLTLINRFI